MPISKEILTSVNLNDDSLDPLLQTYSSSSMQFGYSSTIGRFMERKAQKSQKVFAASRTVELLLCSFTICTPSKSAAAGSKASNQA